VILGFLTLLVFLNCYL